MTTVPKTPIGQPRPGAIKVGSEILMHLGQGIYSTPANAIKEFVSNAYDADAEKVTIRAKPDMDNLVVMDDGEGMNEEDFDQHFAIVAKSFRRAAGSYTPKYHRPIIGRFGIGFLAISQLCDRIQVISTKRGEPFRFEATIDFAQYRAKAKQVAEYEYEIAPYTIVNYAEDPEQHYTVIILDGLAQGFRDDLLDKKLEVLSEELPGRYSRIREDLTGHTFEEIARQLLSGTVRDLHRQLGGYWVFMLDLASIVPIPYLDNGPIRFSEDGQRRFSEQAAMIDRLKESVEELHFSVDFDGIDLKKPFLLPSAYFPTGQRELSADEYHVEIFEHDEVVSGQRLSFRGYLYNQRYSITPSEFRGIVVRIKNTAIGGMKADFLEYPAPEKLFFQQSMGEIYIEEGLEDAMNIDRATFRIGHPHYTFLQQYLHHKLARLFKESRQRYVRRRKVQEIALQAVVLSQLQELFGRPFEIRASDRPTSAPVDLNTDRGVATVYRRHGVFRELSAGERRIRASDLLLFEAAAKLRQEPQSLRELYHQLLARRDGASGG